MLLDSASLYFRAFFGVPDQSSAPDGTPVNAVRGLPRHDRHAGRRRTGPPARRLLGRRLAPAFRVDADPLVQDAPVAEGSDARTGGDPDRPRRRRCRSSSTCWPRSGIARLGGRRVRGGRRHRHPRRPAPRRRAGTSTSSPATATCSSSSTTPPACGCSTPAAACGNLEIVDEAALRDEVRRADGAGYADLAVLRGDPSDGLPGVAGIGEKTAAPAARHGTATWTACSPPSTPATRTALRAPAASCAPPATTSRRRPSVVRVVRDAPLPGRRRRAAGETRRPGALAALADRWGVGSSSPGWSKRLGGELTPPSAADHASGADLQLFAVSGPGCASASPRRNEGGQTTEE